MSRLVVIKSATQNRSENATTRGSRRVSPIRPVIGTGGVTVKQEEPTPVVQDQELRIPLPTSFDLDFIRLTRPATLKARLVGPEKAPVILVLGGISADRNVCDSETGATGWWQEVAGSGKALDTNQYRLLSFDFFPGRWDLRQLAKDALSKPNGKPLDDEHASAHISTADQARIAAYICDYLDIDRLHAFVGASYGGMVALSFAEQFPHQVGHTIVACAAHRPHPMGTAWRSIQRKIVRFGLETGQPDRALSLARELGMTTYRTPDEFGERFPSTKGRTPFAECDVERYLGSRGEAFINRMPPERYLCLSHSVDCHHVEPEQIQTPVTLIGCRQDQLVPIEEMRLLKQSLPQAAALVEFDSLYGHDAFLKEVEIISEAIRTALSTARKPSPVA